MSLIVNHDSELLLQLKMKKAKSRYEKKQIIVDLYKEFKVEKEKYVHIPFAFAIEQGYEVCDSGWKDVDVKFMGTLREHQVSLLNQVDSKLREFGHAFLSSHCGSGKTFMSIKTISKIGLRTWVLVDSLTTAKQWKNEILEFAPECNVEIIESGQKKIPEADVYISLPTIVRSISFDILKTIGFLIVDEAKVFCSDPRMQSILSFTPKFALGLSADYERTDRLHLCLDKVFGRDRIKVISTKPFKVMKIMTEFTLSVDIAKRKNAPWTDVIAHFSLIPERNQMIADMIIQDVKDGKKVLILCRLKKQIRILKELISKHVERVEILIEDMTGYLNCDVLLGTSKIGKAFDAKSSCNEIWDKIHFNKFYFGCDVLAIEQNVGRVFRSEFPIVVDFVDNFSTFKNHFVERKKWYEERNGEIEVVNLQNML